MTGNDTTNTARQTQGAYERYMQGEKMAVLAAGLGLSYEALRKRFLAAYGPDYALRGVGNYGSTRRVLSDGQVEEAWQAYKADRALSLTELGKRYYVSDNTMRNAFTRLHPEEYYELAHQRYYGGRNGGKRSISRAEAERLFALFSGPEILTADEMVEEAGHSWPSIRKSFLAYGLVTESELRQLTKRAHIHAAAEHQRRLTDKQLEHILWQLGHMSTTLRDIAKSYCVSCDCIRNNLTRLYPEEYRRVMAAKKLSGRAANGTRRRANKR